MAIKSLEDLRKIKAESKKQTETRKLNDRQIIIGMGTCGITAGARAVMTAVLEELAKRNIYDVAVLQTGCIGMCQKEPLLDIVRPGEDRVTYGPVSPTDVPRIIADHLINGVVVEDLVVAKIPNKEA
ncbi:(2Fe-2S) ferredoxin domain-containing protein [Cloacibacillus sp.]|uniref:(2Fe-2S) ferredoxin domain-containing protein n=1 Tax=Cloacibacillus sp. TaxID=2049023 RepID=UPI0025C3798A|nr:(2Fe-2S) ferredoxin domain-containing protein [Cloacibacillus sp.]MCC8057484.1 (2Fe-2S) ferredoxin domain-containing protein [Cloacibacillus sp.]